MLERVIVPDKLMVDLMRPYLSERAVKLLSHLETSQMEDYEIVKRYILSQLRLSPRLFLERFNGAVKQQNETAVLFASRLKTLLKYYLDSRKVSTFEKLFSLLISDKIKATLNEDCLNHVLSVEALADDGWVSHDKLGDLIDTYDANRVNGRPRASAIGAGSVQYSSKVNNKGTDGAEMRGEQVSGQQFVDRRPTNGTAQTVGPGVAPKSCWHCGGHHLKRNCPQLSAGERPGERSADASVGGRTKSVRVNQAVAAACGSEPAAGGEVQVQANQCVVSRPTCVAAGAADGGGTPHVFVAGEVPGGGGDAGVTERAGIAGMQGLSQSTMVTRAVDDAAAERQGTGTREGGIRGCEPRIVDCVMALSYVNVTVKEISGKVIRALNDSGSQLTIVKRTVLEGHAFPACGSVKIRGLLGASVAADLTYLSIALADCTNCSLRLLCAVSDDVYEDLIIPAAVVTRLNDQFNELLGKAHPAGESCSTDAVVGNAAVAADASGSTVARSVAEPDILDSNFLDVDQVDGAAIDPSVATVAELQREQAGDKALASEWALVKRNKGSLLVKDGLLFCYEKFAGNDRVSGGPGRPPPIRLRYRAFSNRGSFKFPENSRQN
jgi:hypothetical protein